MLPLHTCYCEFSCPQVDAFVSHSWDDDHKQRYAALARWAEDFRKAHGRSPVIWLDKACIDQRSIEDSLKCLPVFLAGCNSLVVLGGKRWPARLWVGSPESNS